MEIKELVFWDIICAVSDDVIGQDDDRTWVERHTMQQVLKSFMQAVYGEGEVAVGRLIS